MHAIKKCSTVPGTPRAGEGSGCPELPRLSFEEPGWAGGSPRPSCIRVTASFDAGHGGRRSFSRGPLDQQRSLSLIRASPSPRVGTPSPRIKGSPWIEKDKSLPTEPQHGVTKEESILSNVPLRYVAEIPRRRPGAVPPRSKSMPLSREAWGQPTYDPKSSLAGNIIPAPPAPTDNFHLLYELQEKLGAGSYGEVYKATEKATGRPVAVKTMSLRPEQCNPHRVKLEVAMLKRLANSKSIAKFYEMYEEDDRLHIVMELCTGGDLRDYIQENGPVSEAQAAVAAFEIFLLLQELHNERIVHGDVKPANFVITSKLSYQLFKKGVPFLSRGWLKGVDFGCSQHTGRGRIHHKIGTPSHWAPEVFAQDYHMEADLWSAGVTIYELLTGQHPFCTKKEQQRMSERDYLKALMFKEPDFSSTTLKGVSSDCLNFLKRLLCKNCKNRLTVKEALDHAWMKNQLHICKAAEKAALDDFPHIHNLMVPALNSGLL